MSNAVEKDLQFATICQASITNNATALKKEGRAWQATRHLRATSSAEMNSNHFHGPSRQRQSAART
jgi:hypothetical protein